MLQGILQKMQVSYNQPIDYYIELNNTKLHLNNYLGKKIAFKYLNKITCLGCGATTKKSYSQGFCYKCFLTHPQTSPCILRPELCEAHKGISRDMQWSENHCLINHIVYLAVSSDIKVGVTREPKSIIRWIDQGASATIKLARTPNRYLAGCIEVCLKSIFTDKTNWQKMLRNELLDDINLPEQKQKAWESITEDYKGYFIDDDQITQLQYPVLEFPTKIKSLSFDQNPEIEGILTGIKGQYLIFNNQNVINIRKHGGYNVCFEAK